MSNTPEVLIISAGISGLTAAHTLQKAGCIVRVLEANDHPGERMVTVDFRNGRAHGLGTHKRPVSRQAG